MKISERKNHQPYGSFDSIAARAAAISAWSVPSVLMTGSPADVLQMPGPRVLVIEAQPKPKRAAGRDQHRTLHRMCGDHPVTTLNRIANEHPRIPSRLLRESEIPRLPVVSSIPALHPPRAPVPRERRCVGRRPYRRTQEHACRDLSGRQRDQDGRKPLGESWWRFGFV